MTQTNYYEILGVSQTATPQEIRAAHRALSRKYHPDTAANGSGDPHAFARVQEAYEALCNSDFRRRYDNKHSATRSANSHGPRRLRKSPCVVCSKPVYASQLRLYLGRHMCMLCLDQRKSREKSRVRITFMNEISWKLKQYRFWAQSHLPLVAFVALAVGLAGMRVAWVISRGHQNETSAEQDSAPGTSNTASSSQSHTPNANTAPPEGTKSADVRGFREYDK